MQIHPFSDLEGLRVAAEMEKRGGEFYRRAAKIAKSEGTRAFLTRLAGEENAHQSEFAKLYARAQNSGAAKREYDEEASALLTAIAADIVFPGGIVGLGCTLEDPRAVLEYAMRSERDSIAFYTQMRSRATDEAAARAFDDIRAQENAHLTRLKQLLSQLDESEAHV